MQAYLRHGASVTNGLDTGVQRRFAAGAFDRRIHADAFFSSVAKQFGDVLLPRIEYCIGYAKLLDLAAPILIWLADEDFVCAERWAAKDKQCTDVAGACDNN